MRVVEICSWLGQLVRDRLKYTLPALALVTTFVLLVVVRNPLPVLRWDLTEANLYRDSKLILDWQGFGAEKGLYNFTVVTALLDIGRHNWSQQARGFNEYLLYMHRVLRLDVNMVIFIDPRGRPMVDWMRRGREARTKVFHSRLPDLPYYQYRDRIQEVMNSQEYRQDNELVRKGLCEAKVPEYDIVQWSKLYFLHQAIQLNAFRNDYFVWLDAGYGRGQDIHPPGGVWRPVQLLQWPERVTFMEREDVETYRPLSGRLHKMSVNIIPGGFFGGGSAVLLMLYKLQQRHIADWLQAGVVDDDQTLYMQLYFKHPELFRLVRADWYDAFMIFS